MITIRTATCMGMTYFFTARSWGHWRQYRRSGCPPPGRPEGYPGWTILDGAPVPES